MERYFKHPLLFWDCYKTAFSFWNVWNVTACAPRKVIFANVRFRVKYFLKCVIPFGKWISVWKWNNSVFRNISDRRHSLFLDSAILRKTAISRNVSDKREKARVGNVWKETWVVWWVRKIFWKIQLWLVEPPWLWYATNAWFCVKQRFHETRKTKQLKLQCEIYGICSLNSVWISACDSFRTFHMVHLKVIHISVKFWIASVKFRHFGRKQN